jgi:hypothetical protein
MHWRCKKFIVQQKYILLIILQEDIDTVKEENYMDWPDEDPVYINIDDIYIPLAISRKRAEHEVSLFLKFWSGGQCVCMCLSAMNFPLVT